MVKVFPSSLGGPGYIKAIKGPLPHIPLVPTGGVNLDTVAPFLEAGASALAVGGNLVNRKLISAGDFKGLTELAAKFTKVVEETRHGISES